MCEVKVMFRSIWGKKEIEQEILNEDTNINSEVTLTNSINWKVKKMMIC